MMDLGVSMEVYQSQNGNFNNNGKINLLWDFFIIMSIDI